MRHAVSATLVLAAYCLGNPVGAQRLPFESYSMNEGLVHNHVREIFQDSKGFIWISTWDGVSMFDGNKFVNYNTSNGLSWSLINQVFETPAGDICIVSNHGDIDRIQNHQGPQALHRGGIVFNRFRQATGNTYFALTDARGIYKFNEGVLVKPSQSRPEESYYDITQFTDSLLLALGYSSIQLMNLRYEVVSELQAVSDQRCILVDSKERAWVGTREGLILVSPSQERGKPLRLSDLPEPFDVPELTDAPIKAMLEDKEGSIWIGTANGLMRISADGSRQFITESNGLPSSQITCLMQDREGNIWTGTTKGVARLMTQSSIRIFTVESGLQSNDILHLLPLNDGSIVVQTEEGVQLHHVASYHFTPLALDQNFYSDKDQHSALALITEGGPEVPPTLTFYNERRGSLRFSPSYAGGTYAYRDHRSHFFRPSHTGLLMSSDYLQWHGTLTDSDCRALLIDSENRIWVGLVDSGLLCLRYAYVNDTPRLVARDRYLPGIGIRSVYEDSKGFIWAGTRYHGVFRLHPETPDVTPLHFDQSTGLTSGFVGSIGEDKDGAIWLDFQNGLDKLIPADSSYRVFNFSRFNNFFTVIQAMVFDSDHALWLATTEGMVSITDGELEDLRPLPVYITTALLGDSVYHYGNTEAVVLDYRDKNVHFEFTAPFFINAKQVAFSYRLLGGHNENWSAPSGERNVSYASLEPGTYRFEVRNKGWNGAWGPPASFDFSIAPPLWQTTLFRISSVLFLVAGGWLLFRIRIKSIRHEADMQRQITESKMMALRSQMNPHFIFNCLNSIDNLMQNNEKEKATAYLARFAKLIRAILENSKQEQIPIWKDIETLRLYLELELLRCDHQFDFSIDVAEEILEGDYKIPPLVIQPFVENAIHHGLLNKEDTPRDLSIHGELKDGYIHFRIVDNGVGREQAQKLREFNKAGHKSLGIQITRERLSLLNLNGRTETVRITDLMNENHEALGTQVDIQFKY